MFLQENNFDADIPTSQGMGSIPIFKYRYDNSTKKLQIYIEYNGRRCRSTVGYTVRVTSDNPNDVSIPSSQTLMTGTEVEADYGMCHYRKDGNIGIGTNNPGSYKLKVNGSMDVTGTITYNNVTYTNNTYNGKYDITNGDLELRGGSSYKDPKIIFGEVTTNSNHDFELQYIGSAEVVLEIDSELVVETAVGITNH